MTKIYRNRLISFFDILGFSELLKTISLETLHERYGSLIDLANTKVFYPLTVQGSKVPQEINFEKTQFLFDSIVLVSNPIEEIKNISKFIMASNLFMEKAFQAGLPIRGCIAKGDFLDDPERNIFLSAVFPDLVNGEKSQEWIGCFLTKEAEAPAIVALLGDVFYQNKATETIRQNFPIIPYAIPLKKGKEHLVPNKPWCLNWCYFLDADSLEKGLETIRSPKKENTQKYFQHLKRLPDEVAKVSSEFQPAVVMKAMKTRSGMRVQFLDDKGITVAPGCKQFTIGAFEPKGTNE